MDWGSGRARRPGGAGNLRRIAASAWMLLALTLLSLATAGPDPVPLQLPIVQAVQIAPDPVLPPAVSVFATIVSTTVPIRHVRFLIDDPANASYRFMVLADGLADTLNESFVWSGEYADFGPGWHTLYVHASEDRNTWGPFETLRFRAEEPTSYGPLIAQLDAGTEVVGGVPFTVMATVVDVFARPPWDSSVAEAEFFLDTYLGDGNGIRMEGAFGGGTVDVSWTGMLDLSPGAHTLLAHAKNGYGVWGALRSTSFLARAPTLTLDFVADRAAAHRNETVSYGATFLNVGNANATVVWVNITLPMSVRYESSTVPYVTLDGATYGWVFADVGAEGETFEVTARVVTEATDGTSLGAIATLDYTNAEGGVFEPISATASAAVVAPELAVTLIGPSRTLAGEIATLNLRLEHTGIRSIPLLEIALDDSPWTDPVSPTTMQVTNLPPGSHDFALEERMVPIVPDGERVSRTATVRYTSRFGEPVELLASLAFDVDRPVLTLRVDVDRREVLAGDRIQITAQVRNEGSVAASMVHVRLLVPQGFARVGGAAPVTSSGTEHTWIRTQLPPGALTVPIVLEARAAGTVSLEFVVTYASPNGAVLEAVSEQVVLRARERPPFLEPQVVALSATGAAVLLGAFLTTERGKTGLLFLLVPLYVRMQREKVLDNETRGMIRGYILANPGDHYNSIREALELPNGTLAHHIQILQREALVRSVKDGKYRRFYPSEMKVPEAGEPTKIQRVILDLIRTNPGVTSRDAASLLGLASSTVAYHLEHLEELGRVVYRREGIAKRLYAGREP